MSSPTKTKSGPDSSKYIRLKDLAARYGYSSRHVLRLVEEKVLPPPMKMGNAHVWPTGVLDEIDQQRDDTYRQRLIENGFMEESR